MEVSSGIQWPFTLEGNTASRPCRDAGPMFRVGPQASRLCNGRGEWENADLTTCTLGEIEQPFLLAWFVIETEEYTADMEQEFIKTVSDTIMFLMA